MNLPLPIPTLSLRPLGTMLGTIGLLVSAASAQSINLDFGPNLPYGKPLLGYGGAAFQPGQWNQISGNAGPYAGALGGAIIDTAGQGTPAMVRLTAGADFECNFTVGCNGAGPPGSNDEALMDDCSRFQNASDLLIQGLDPGFYGVYVYAWAPDNAAAITVVDGVNVGGVWPGGQFAGLTYMQKAMVPVAQNVPLKIKLRGATGSLNGVQLVYFGPFVGTSYCQGVPNTSGFIASTSSFGSDIAGNNELFLGVSGLPENTFGFILTSQTQGFTANAGGSAGNLCLGGSIGRGVGGQIYNSGTDGTFVLLVDLTSLPTPSGNVAVSPGETWNFQAWFRDTENGTATSNYSDGHSIMFR